MINISKLNFVVDIDVKRFFDNINHKKLIKQLQIFKIIDKKILSIIKYMLKIETVLPNKEIVLSEKAFSVTSQHSSKLIRLVGTLTMA